MSAGFAPSEFWSQTIGTYTTAMRGAVDRQRMQSEHDRARAYQLALLMRCDELPDQQEWITGKKDRAAYVRKFNEQWDRLDASLAASRASK